MITIALDAMGGDNAPQSVIGGLTLALNNHSNLNLKLFGDEAILAPLLPKQFIDRIQIIHCLKTVGNEDKASQVVRRGGDTTMGRAIHAVKDNEADAAISSGNTGALMALSLFTLRTLKGIDRPAICSAFPTKKSYACMLDLGANVECSSEHLVQFAVMGEVFARTVLNIETPTIGLLNIGVEAMKGNDTIRQAAIILENTPLKGHFKGYVEGDDIGKGDVDVIVVDGFTGNVALKAIEGTASLLTTLLKNAYQSSLMAKIGYLLSKPALDQFKRKLDPRNYNGAVLMGLNGIVIKSHGGSDAVGFANAINVAIDLIERGFYERIAEEMDHLREHEDNISPARSSRQARRQKADL
ncbi:MAG: phosphate acyltransferase PlsX [Alphaproteobacteria bacterium]